MNGKRLALAGALLLFAACFADPPREVARIGLKVLPAEGGTAYVEFDSTGKVTGGHFNSGPQPVAHQDTATIAAAEAHAIFAQAAALGDSMLTIQGPAREEPGQTVLGILFTDNSQVRIIWPTGQEHPDPKVRALVQRLLTHKIGGW